MTHLSRRSTRDDAAAQQVYGPIAPLRHLTYPHGDASCAVAPQGMANMGGLPEEGRR